MFPEYELATRFQQFVNLFHDRFGVFDGAEDLDAEDSVQTTCVHSFLDQGIAVFDSCDNEFILLFQTTFVNFGLNCWLEASVRFDAVNILDAGVIEPMQLISRAWTELKYHSAGGSDEVWDDGRVFVCNERGG